MYSSDLCFSISVPSRVQSILHLYGSFSMGRCRLFVVVLVLPIVLM